MKSRPINSIRDSIIYIKYFLIQCLFFRKKNEYFRRQENKKAIYSIFLANIEKSILYMGASFCELANANCRPIPGRASKYPRNQNSILIFHKIKNRTYTM